jgi:hypothetical protein
VVFGYVIVGEFELDDGAVVEGDFMGEIPQLDRLL